MWSLGFNIFLNKFYEFIWESCWSGVREQAHTFPHTVSFWKYQWCTWIRLKLQGGRSVQGSHVAGRALVTGAIAFCLQGKHELEAKVQSRARTQNQALLGGCRLPNQGSNLGWTPTLASVSVSKRSFYLRGYKVHIYIFFSFSFFWFFNFLKNFSLFFNETFKSVGFNVRIER